ncbi:uncharacterized protein LOC123549784 [Mercenaria mercenaria]|uniref:uncharacterized protein LOC123549784 n=1 Tax=Mercenaria mercenaria TaxID=6596 RepID=UPI00234E9C0E|nr:uncharacterized protein LOC123549784 [Mercenaria mercenaria]
MAKLERKFADFNLFQVAAETRNKDLRPWVPDLINHFWHCCQIANGNEDVLPARWRGALHHVTNVHEWISGDDAIEPKCELEELEEKEDDKWLEAGSPAHEALTHVMLDTRFLHNLHHYADFRHTGELETFHEHILVNCAKRFAYTYPVYKARNYLAGLDYQIHKERPFLMNKNGEFRLHRCFSK